MKRNALIVSVPVVLAASFVVADEAEQIDIQRRAAAAWTARAEGKAADTQRPELVEARAFR